MSGTHQQIFQACSKELIGIPYEVKDCWGIVVLFYAKVFGIELKNYYHEIPKERSVTKSLVYSNMGDFDQVTDRRFGDIILIKLFGIESHIAVYLGDGLILHTNEKTGCVVDRISRWEKLIVGFYRIKQNDKA